MSVRFLVPPSRTPRLHGSAKSALVYSPLAALVCHPVIFGPFLGCPSSDLNVRQVLGAAEQDAQVAWLGKIGAGVLTIGGFGLPSGDLRPLFGMPVFRSEERRVGKECRS